MVAASELLMWVEIAVGLAVLGGCLWSAWRGRLRQVYSHISRIPVVESKVEQLNDTQDSLRDAVIAEGYAIKYDSVVLDPEAVEDDLRDDEGPARYIRRGDVVEDTIVREGSDD